MASPGRSFKTEERSCLHVSTLTDFQSNVANIFTENLVLLSSQQLQLSLSKLPFVNKIMPDFTALWSLHMKFTVCFYTNMKVVLIPLLLLVVNQLWAAPDVTFGRLLRSMTYTPMLIILLENKSHWLLWNLSSNMCVLRSTAKERVLCF